MPATASAAVTLTAPAVDPKKETVRATCSCHNGRDRVQGAGDLRAAGRDDDAAVVLKEIEESGLFGGITSRIKKSADAYVNQKLDEIEARIDRKLDEIDRRLAEWRDKEIANRIRILKITLWASVIVGAFSLLYSYAKVYIVGP